MKSTLISILIACAILGTLYFVFKTGDKEFKEINTIVAFGDSLTYGYGSTEGNDYVSVLERKIGKQIINMGVNGDTTAGALSRIDTVLEAQPDLVIVFLGGNDALRRISQVETFANLETIVSKLVEQGIEVVLVGVPGAALGDPYAKQFELIARKHDITYVPQFMKSLIINREYMYDGIHPNNKGYEIVAERIYEGIEGWVK